MKLTSPAFKEGEPIPQRYTSHGEDVNPKLLIEGIPKEAKSLSLIVDDPDAPMKDVWVHWVVFNIPITDKIEEHSIPGVQGLNDFEKEDYGGPAPPSGTHRYFFKLYALDTHFDLQSPTSDQLQVAMQGHILAEATLMGRFSAP